MHSYFARLRLGKNSDALVSVIVPIYNVERFLAQCLESIKGQTHQTLEIICINDGSTDSSAMIAHEFASKDERFAVIDKQNEGYGATCNLGLEMARGTWVSIIEPDDWIDPSMYATMLSFASRFGKSLDIIKTPWFDVRAWDDATSTYEEKCSLTNRLPTSKAPFTIEQHPILLEIHPSIWSALYRRDYLNEKSIRFVPHPGAGWADNPFMVETLCQASAIAYLNTPFYHYRCELAEARMQSRSDADISLPFDRWAEMLAILDRLGLNDSQILQAHYLRGFNYAHDAMCVHGLDNALVQSRIHEMFAAMNEDLVLANPKLRKSRKQFYLDQMGMSKRASSSPARLGYALRELLLTMRTNGIAGVKRRLRGA